MNGAGRAHRPRNDVGVVLWGKSAPGAQETGKKRHVTPDRGGLDETNTIS